MNFAEYSDDMYSLDELVQDICDLSAELNFLFMFLECEDTTEWTNIFNLVNAHQKLEFLYLNVRTEEKQKKESLDDMRRLMKEYMDKNPAHPLQIVFCNGKLLWSHKKLSISAMRRFDTIAREFCLREEGVYSYLNC